MYAIVEIAGKQYKVEKDATVNVDRLEMNPDESLVIDKILLLSKDDEVMIGQPYLTNVTIQAKVLGELKGEKVRGIKFGKRKRHTRTFGHRQTYSRILISDMTVN